MIETEREPSRESGSVGRSPKRRFTAVPWLLTVFALLTMVLALACQKKEAEVVDSAKANGRTVGDFPETDVDLYHDMDGGIPLTAAEIKGRNTWMLWTADNGEFWEWMPRYGFGTTDLLKMLDSRRRPHRFEEMGLMNDPRCRAATGPDANGLWLDEVATPEPPGIDPKIYGLPSGVLGLRLFPNPEFDAAARAKWNAEKFYTDPAYYNRRDVIRPYRVGMACGFCHVGPNPVHPPADPDNPQLADLSTYIGNQYFRVAAIFGNGLPDSSFIYQLLNALPRGALDTSFLATDNLNNPSNMNAIFSVAARLSVAAPERVGSEALNLPGEESTMVVPHILKDGSDSIGLLGALSRVFVNIGEYHAEWLRDHNLLVGGRAQKPFRISNARKNSVYWLATETRMSNLRDFFLKAARPMPLVNAPGHDAFPAADAATLDRGREVFADQCASCHSSKRPPAGMDPRSEQAKAWFREEVRKPDFLDDNFLSDDQRHPVTVIKTNAARALATNATRGHVWDNFSSETYKQLPSAGDIEWYDPFDSKTHTFHAPAGGPGYYRTPSLVSCWATAPFFHDNSLGIYTGDPSVAGRMRAFDDAVEKLLWPAKRLGPKSIWITTRKSTIDIPTPYLPWFLRWLGDRDYLRIGPIPKGTPINLIANADLSAKDPMRLFQLARIIHRTKNDLLQIRLKNLDDAASARLMKNLVPDLYSISKCPDFVQDRGHEFGTELTDSDKRALIAYMKTF